MLDLDDTPKESTMDSNDVEFKQVRLRFLRIDCTRCCYYMSLTRCYSDLTTASEAALLRSRLSPT